MTRAQAEQRMTDYREGWIQGVNDASWLLVRKEPGRGLNYDRGYEDGQTARSAAMSKECAAILEDAKP